MKNSSRKQSIDSMGSAGSVDPLVYAPHRLALLLISAFRAFSPLSYCFSSSSRLLLIPQKIMISRASDSH